MNFGIDATRKFFLAMKLTVFLLTIFSLQVSADAFSQKISLSFEDAPLTEVMESISRQSGYDFLFDARYLRNAKPITLETKEAEIGKVLEQVFSGQPFTYSIKGKAIIVMPASPQPEAIYKIQRQRSIRGTVTDTTGVPLPAVAVQVKGTNIGTLTNAYGEYEIEGVPDDAELIFTLLGFQNVEVLAINTEINIVLQPVSALMEEVEVNAGYWKVSEKFRTGNISKVSGETIQQQPVVDPMLALAGRVPGLQIGQNSGLPGSYHTIRIRGTNSIANGNDPLFLVDGVPFNPVTLSSSVFGGGATALSPFALLNAGEIESIEVLKDADATAIYGSRGANGVILITTKKGKAGPTRFNVNAYTGVGKVTRMVDLLNTKQYLEMREEAFLNDGITDYPASSYDINGTWDASRYTDWQDLMIGNTAHMSNIQLQVSGGTAQTQFTAGGGWMKESTVFPGDYNTTKSSANLSIHHRSTNQRFGVSASVRFLKSIGDQPHADVSINQIFLPPNAPSIYAENGSLNWENNTWYNPFANFLLRAKSTSKNIQSNGELDYRILPGLQAKITFGYNEQSMDQALLRPIKAFNPSLWIYPAIRSHRHATKELITLIGEPQLNYSRTIGKGTLDATIGATFQKSNQEALAISANNFTDDALIENIAAAATVTVSQNLESEYRYAALFGRLHYNWQDIYLINLVARRDGSSRFAPGRKYGNFGSIGAAWIFSNEPFFKNSVISFGKLRGSYGITGNDQLSDYQYFNTYSSYSYPYLGITGLYPTRLHSPDYGWEAVRKMEAAIELGFMQGRIGLSVSFYRNRTDNQLVGYTLPTITGFSSIQANLPAVIQNTGWEFELNTLNVKGSAITWNTSINLSIPRNKLISFPELETSTYRNRYEIGKSLSTRKLWHYTGVDPASGIVQYEDVNGDGKISSPEDLQSLIDVAPRYFGGFLSSLHYSGIQLDIFLQFVRKIGQTISLYPGTMSNRPSWVLNRWQKPGDITDIPQFSQGGASYEAIEGSRSDIFYGDASYLRLKNVSLSYQLPEPALELISAISCRIYLQCQNLLTFTGYKGLDPETQTALPPIRIVTAGINLTF